MALRDLGFLDESIEYFQKAIELGSVGEGWVVRAGMATVHVSTGDYAKAIEAQEVCMQQDSAACKGCHRLVDISNILIRRYCHNFIFCGTCLQRRRSGTLPVNICSQKHDWIILPPLPQVITQRSEEQKDIDRKSVV